MNTVFDPMPEQRPSSESHLDGPGAGLSVAAARWLWAFFTAIVGLAAAWLAKGVLGLPLPILAAAAVILSVAAGLAWKRVSAVTILIFAMFVAFDLLFGALLLAFSCDTGCTL